MPLFTNCGTARANFLYCLSGELRANLTLHAGYAATAFERLDAGRPVPPDMSQSHGNALIQQFLAELFTLRVEDGDEHLYAASIAIAEVFLSGLKSNRYRSIDGIRYPSIARRANSDNFALSIDFVRTGLEFVCSHLIQMNAADDEGASGMCIDSAVAGVRRWSEMAWRMPLAVARGVRRPSGAALQEGLRRRAFPVRRLESKSRLVACSPEPANLGPQQSVMRVYRAGRSPRWIVGKRVGSPIRGCGPIHGVIVDYLHRKPSWRAMLPGWAQIRAHTRNGG